ncbi:MAG: DinB family protein [Chitinophagales bacterium]|nr:DinB family protein [Chitinophagales bacterium]
MSYSIYKHLQFNAWANGKIVEILKNLDESLLDKELKSSFPTIRKTVYHIWDAELIWFRRIKGEQATTWPSEDLNETFLGSLERWQKTSEEIAAFVKTKDKHYLNGTITYTNTKGLQFTNRIEDLLFHLVNHGTFHRGQLITMLREVGEEKLPSTDLIAYIRQLEPTLN